MTLSSLFFHKLRNIPSAKSVLEATMFIRTEHHNAIITITHSVVLDSELAFPIESDECDTAALAFSVTFYILLTQYI